MRESIGTVHEVIPSNSNELLSKLAKYSISDGTYRLYNSRITILKEFSVKKGFERITKEAFGLYLAELASHNSSPSTFEGYRSALIFYQEVERFDLLEGDSIWAKDPLLRRATDGAIALILKKQSIAPSACLHI